jgi:hypothetical protein
VPWHAVIDVAAENSYFGPTIKVRALPEDARIRRRTWGRWRESLRPSFFAVYGRALAVDPAVAYHALRYYHAHPRARAELITPAGEQRIRSLLG